VVAVVEVVVVEVLVVVVEVLVVVGEDEVLEVAAVEAGVVAVLVVVLADVLVDVLADALADAVFEAVSTCARASSVATATLDLDGSVATDGDAVLADFICHRLAFTRILSMRATGGITAACRGTLWLKFWLPKRLAPALDWRWPKAPYSLALQLLHTSIRDARHE